MNSDKDLNSQYMALISNKNIFSMLGILNMFFVICAIADMNFTFMLIINVAAVYYCLKADIKNDIKLALIRMKMNGDSEQ